MLIYFHQVNKHYGDFHVLKDINLTIKKGEVIVIIVLVWFWKKYVSPLY